MYILLKLMEEEIGTERFKSTRVDMWNQHRAEGFYVNVPKNKFTSLLALIKYVTRYVARPVMAQSRIIDYDKTYVTFWYQRHEDDKIVIERVHACEFISRLIIHIPDKHFKYIRYFGAYQNSNKEKKPLKKLFTDFVISTAKKVNKWRQRIINDFKRDPLICPVCNYPMIYHKSVFT